MKYIYAIIFINSEKIFKYTVYCMQLGFMIINHWIRSISEIRCGEYKKWELCFIQSYSGRLEGVCRRSRDVGYFKQGSFSKTFHLIFFQRYMQVLFFLIADLLFLSTN